MATTPMPAMPTPMVTMDTTARGPLMPRPLLLLRPMLMLTMAPMAMAWPTMDTVMPAMPIPMPTTDTTARGPLTLLLLLMLTMELMAMAWPTTAMVMDMPTTAMPTMDTTDIPTPPDTTDIINLLIFVKN